MKPHLIALIASVGLATPLAVGSITRAEPDDVPLLVSAMLAETPIMEDLRELTDGIGGRPAGSEANRKAVEWGRDKFVMAGVNATIEAFESPRLWLEASAEVIISGPVTLSPAVVAMPFSAETGPDGLTAVLLDGGSGSEADFIRLGDAAKGAFVLIETQILDDARGLDGLFADYADSAAIEDRAYAAGVAGVAYMASRPGGHLYRHNASRGFANTLPLLVIDREASNRALRFLRAGEALTLTARIALEGGSGSFTNYNVIGEIPGGDLAQEIVVMGAHLDSHELGTGALDNGANVSMIIDIARQIVASGIQPRRTIRFVLFNNEEVGLWGSMQYTKTHAAELDNHVLGGTIDIGTGRIVGFFHNGRDDLVPMLDAALGAVGGLGPWTYSWEPIVGTDNFDFMLEGVPNIVAFQTDANYASNYHARSDTFDKVDALQLKINSAIMAAVTLYFANSDQRLPRMSVEDVETLLETTTLPAQMRSFGVWEDWENGIRGRH